MKAREIASIVGKIISMSLAVGPISRLMTRSLYALLNTRSYWCQALQVTPKAREEVNFWRTQLDLINGREIWHSPSAIRVVYSDASATGYGGYTVEHGGYVAHGAWSIEEMAQSSTWRELKAVRMTLQSLVSKLKNERVKWFSDNQNVVRILEIGSRKPNLQEEALAVFSFASQNLIRTEPQWISCYENQVADYLSHLQDTNDWRIQPLIFWAPYN